jgi:hypothetical protein
MARARIMTFNAGWIISMPWTRGSAAAAVLLATTTGLFAPATGLAQQTDVGFSLGFYNPIGALVQRGMKSVPATFYQQRLQGTPSLGANVVVWTSSRLGIAGSINITPSDVAQTDTTGTHDHSSAVVLGSVRAIYAFTPMLFKAPAGRREIPWSFYVGAGAGIVNRSGAVWAYYSGLTSPALLLNVGVRTAVGARVLLRFDLEDYVSRAQFDKGLATQTEARTHNDILLSLSVNYRMVR